VERTITTRAAASVIFWFSMFFLSLTKFNWMERGFTPQYFLLVTSDPCFYYGFVIMFHAECITSTKVCSGSHYRVQSLQRAMVLFSLAVWNPSFSAPTLPFLCHTSSCVF
jgi:hypothetical protein